MASSFQFIPQIHHSPFKGRWYPSRGWVDRLESIPVECWQQESNAIDPTILLLFLLPEALNVLHDSGAVVRRRFGPTKIVSLIDARRRMGLLTPFASSLRPC